LDYASIFIIFVEEKPIAAEKQTRLNSAIRVPQVRLIDAEGNQVGIVSTDEARKLALEAELDLVEISPNASPPVCRIMNYGKFLFEKNKKRQVAKKNQKQIQVKEIKFRPGTDIGDYQVKLRNLTRFLEEGDKTKITVRFRGREMAHQDLGMQLLKRVENDLAEISIVEQFPKKEGRQMVMVLTPKQSKK
jgi:translation initiation factor IF-3